MAKKNTTTPAETNTVTVTATDAALPRLEAALVAAWETSGAAASDPEGLWALRVVEAGLEALRAKKARGASPHTAWIALRGELGLDPHGIEETLQVSVEGGGLKARFPKDVYVRNRALCSSYFRACHQAARKAGRLARCGKDQDGGYCYIK